MNRYTKNLSQGHRERWENIATLTSRENYQHHNRPVYPPEFWMTQHVTPPPVSNRLRNVVLGAAILVCIFIWAFVFANGGRF